MEKRFFELPWQEREKIASHRRQAAKYIVWDYCPDKEGNYGVIERLPAPTDKGFIHGFEIISPKVFADEGGYSHFIIHVYSDFFPLDETFENRSKNMWHLFTTLEKAQAYAEKVRGLFPEKLTYESVLPYILKAFPKAQIVSGRRGYETSTPAYQCICADHGWTTFHIKHGVLFVQFGQGCRYVIPHTELITPAFTNIKQGNYINRDFSCGLYGWEDFYGIRF